MRVTRLYELPALIAIGVLAGHSSASAQTAPQDTARAQVRVVGTGQRHVAPDLALVKLSFVAEGRTPREAGRRVGMRADSLRRALTSIGIPRDSLTTASEWNWWAGRVETVVSNGRFVQLPKPDSLGRLAYNLQDKLFRAHDAIEVRVAQIGKIGAVIDTAMAHGISEISQVQFQASNLSTARDQALRDATDDAKHQAESIASAGGMRLGRVLGMSTYTDAERSYFGETRLQEIVITGMAGGGATEVIPRSLPVSMTVYGRWELLPPP